jgi:hypothetical protein
MKKFGKFVFAVLSTAAFAASAYYLLKNVIYKDSSDEFDDFDDEFDDFYFDDDSSEGREYVTLNLGQGEDTKEETSTEE